MRVKLSTAFKAIKSQIKFTDTSKEREATCIGKIQPNEKQQQLPNIFERRQFNNTNNNSFVEAPNKMNIPASDNK